MTIAASSSAGMALRLQLSGRVQGLGVRPAIARLAARLELAGSVRNTLKGLEIRIEGDPDAVAEFESSLAAALPPQCELLHRDREELHPGSFPGFSIERDDAEGPLATRVPPDTAVCGDCLRESKDGLDRRHDYALIGCAACGPRYSIVRRMPYERSATTLDDFPLCITCQCEYESADDRRFHAQSIACPRCGPNIWAVDRQGRRIAAHEQAVTAAIAVLRSGGLVALRGIGGYQLLCDAANEVAVARLRARKCRPAKPLAVLVRDVEAAGEIAAASAAERGLLLDPANPIVLLGDRKTRILATAVNSGMNTVGLMLPTTALHDRIAREFASPLVCTSGNREGESLEFEPRAAEHKLAGIADLWLHHDRPIARPIDDSVVRLIAGNAVTLRLARGLAPLTLDLSPGPGLVALGGHQKSAMAWCNGSQCVLGPHVGDLETLSARNQFTAQYEAHRELYRFEVDSLAHDLHPDYFTSRFAAESRLPAMAVQHHFAHVAAGMLEHNLLEEPVLGIAFDGTGFGPDHTVWGGEFILAESLTSMRRVGHLRSFRLPGGEAAVREPWRVAVSVLADAISHELLLERGLTGLRRSQIAEILQLLERPRLNLVTTSAGRMFDAAAALILGTTHAQFDGEPAMRLEAAADVAADGAYPFPLVGGSARELDWRPLFAALSVDREHGTEPSIMAMRFHRGVARGVAQAVRALPDLPVVLGGGVFQNQLLVELLVEELEGVRRLCLPGRIPPNDGGLAAGQLAIALASSFPPR